MRLLVQPGDGITTLVKAIGGAKTHVQIVIFRLDQSEIERALANAVRRGVAVHALIAHTNRAGEQNLRKLEQRLLAQGVVVSRTADDLARYHGKMMIIDQRELFVLGFNLTYLDVERSRSFGIVTRSKALVQEAVKLFEADTQRHTYEAGVDRFVVSPINARRQLAAFIESAAKELIIYDPKVSDPAMIRLLQERAKAGVDVRIIGKLTRKIPGVTARKMPKMRLHTRTIVRDGRLAFLGSQSLRALELDARREVGVIFNNAKVVKAIAETFESDWALSEQAANAPVEEAESAARVAKRVAKVVTRELPALAPVLDGAIKEVVGARAEVDLNLAEVEELVKDAVKTAVKEAVKDAVEEVVENGGAH